MDADLGSNFDADSHALEIDDHVRHTQSTNLAIQEALQGAKSDQELFFRWRLDVENGGNDRTTIELDARTYCKEAVLAVAYRYSEVGSISISQEGHSWVVSCLPRLPSGGGLSSSFDDLFRSDLIDFQLRAELEDSFRPLREMIVAKAFGSGT